MPIVSTVISRIAAGPLSLPFVRRAWEARREAFRFRLGIAGRLGVAFAAVTVLATAANLISEHGRQLIRTTPVVSPIVRPAPPEAVQPQMRAVAATPPPVPGAETAPVKEVSEHLLIEAINQFERAVERRAEANTPENVDLLKVAGVRIKDQAEAFLEEANLPGVEARTRAAAAARHRFA